MNDLRFHFQTLYFLYLAHIIFDDNNKFTQTF